MTSAAGFHSISQPSAHESEDQLNLVCAGSGGNPDSLVRHSGISIVLCIHNEVGGIDRCVGLNCWRGSCSGIGLDAMSEVVAGGAPRMFALLVGVISR